MFETTGKTKKKINHHTIFCLLTFRNKSIKVYTKSNKANIPNIYIKKAGIKNIKISLKLKNIC